jgi:hypothetical protein
VDPEAKQISDRTGVTGDFTVEHFHEQLVKRHSYYLGYTVTKLTLHAAGLMRPANHLRKVLAVEIAKRNTTTGCSWCRMLALCLKKNRQKIKFRRVCSLEAVSEYHRVGRVYEGQRHAGSGSLSDILPFRRPTGR